MISPTEIVLSNNTANGDATVVRLDPLGGGSIVDYHTDSDAGTFQWLSIDTNEFPSSFPLVPFCSRIKSGRFAFQGQDVQLTLNNLPESDAIHGHGYQQPWRVDQASAEHAVLIYEHRADTWPWSYTARQHFTLVGKRLSVEMAVINHSEKDMPVGLGLHPFFPKSPRVRLTAKVSGLCRLDDELMPVSLDPVPAELDLAAGLSLSAHNLDHVFVGWDGAALIEWPESRVQMKLSQSRPGHLVVWSPSGKPYVCVEPVSNLPNAFNGHDGLAMNFSVLAGGEAIVHRWSFTPEILV